MIESKKIKWNDKAIVEDSTLSILTCTFPNGSTVDFEIGSIFPSFEVQSPIQKRITCYGIKQKLADTTAKNEDEALTIEEKIEVMEGKFNALANGQWNVEGITRESLKKQIESGKANLDQKDQDELDRLLAMAGVKI